MQIAVVFGGRSVEHDISIITGIQVIKALEKNKYQVLPIYMDNNNQFNLCLDLSEWKEMNSKKFKKIIFTNHGFLLKKKFIKVDACVMCVHGKDLEGGSLAGFFEILNIPYTSNTPLSASIIQDKITTKKILKYDKIPTLPFLSFSKEEYLLDKVKIREKVESLTFPIIIKASNLGSSIGLKTIEDITTFDQSMMEIYEYDDNILIEKKLTDFTEYNIAIIDHTILSEIEEIKTTNELLTFDDKYQSKTNRELPAQINDKLKEKLERLAHQCAKSVNNKGVARIDFLYDNITKKLYVNEINSIPGSLAFHLFEKKGLYFEKLLNNLINNCLTYEHFKNQKIVEYKSDVLEKKTYLK